MPPLARGRPHTSTSISTSCCGPTTEDCIHLHINELLWSDHRGHGGRGNSKAHGQLVAAQAASVPAVAGVRPARDEPRPVNDRRAAASLPAEALAKAGPRPRSCSTRRARPLKSQGGAAAELAAPETGALPPAVPGTDRDLARRRSAQRSRLVVSRPARVGSASGSRHADCCGQRPDCDPYQHYCCRYGTNAKDLNTTSTSWRLLGLAPW